MFQLKICKVSGEEQETTISFGRLDGRASVFCNDNTVLTKIQKLLNQPNTTWVVEEEMTMKDGTVVGYKFSCPKDRIMLSGKKKEMSEEQRQLMSERAKQRFGKGSVVPEDIPEEE